ncbi:diphosphomevalonate/mevalonate 3,5-bisphosphate decarboxylase family protein [Maribacter sp. 2307ULW6-5]|uniref:diphosphomevalonate/mevalonate 3,5-bisphosphate decarboxylase family protein n=1 Tax=Maribacter sp. 2307ULW6-5 TaxID=3386275 RepID=UPI0039BCBACF
MIVDDFLPKESTAPLGSGHLTYKAPSNIALVKYWGKRPHQLPANPSVSLTLSHCATTTTVSYDGQGGTANGVSFDLFFEGGPKPSFRPKIETFFSRIAAYVPFLRGAHLKIETSNSFPHSSGIASSASGMAALALCLVEMERRMWPKMSQAHFEQKASFLARLGSGSACRSIAGSLVHWGLHAETQGSSDLYGISYPYPVHPVFTTYQDTILLVDKGQKQVSSTLGHDLMHGHPFAAQRFAQAHDNLNGLRPIFGKGNLEAFVKIVESEALTLHAMMMSSSPYFVLMKPNTLSIIERVWDFRERTGSPICFTLDAGANVHLLYPEDEKERVLPFIERELAPFCEKGQYICDRVGSGAQKM